jgi:hypothetical protein
MIHSLVALLAPLALTTGPNTHTRPTYHQVRAYVTGYNTVVGQTDSTPCIAASGANICGRRDAVACPRRIDLGTVVEIRGTTYVCEDRLARKFNTRFDISCDKDADCPPEVTGWATIKVYGYLSPPAPGKPAPHHTGSKRARWERPRRAVSSLPPAMTRTPSSSLVAILRGVPISRKATPFMRQAWNTRSRASRISGG